MASSVLRDCVPFKTLVFIPVKNRYKNQERKKRKQMLAKVKSNSTISGTVDYCLKKEKKAEIIMSNGASETADPKLIIKQFQAQADQHAPLQKPIMHLIISHSPEDTEKLKGGNEKQILNDFIEKLKQDKGKNKGVDLNSTQYVVIKHSDKNHIHYHILINMVNNEAKRLNDSHIGYKVKSASIAITKQHHLTRPISKELKQQIAEQEKKKSALKPQIKQQTIRPKGVRLW